MSRYRWARVGVEGGILRNRRALLLQRRDDRTLAPEQRDLPGGGLGIGGHVVDPLVREAREETGLTVRVGRPIPAWIDGSRRVGGRRVPGVGRCPECSLRAPREPRWDPREHTESAWVAPEEFRRHPVPSHQDDTIRRAFAAQ